MRIALCHDGIIPPKKYGGTERMVAWLGRALLEAGHDVTLIAAAGSQLPGARFIEAQRGLSWDEQAPQDIDLLHLRSTPQEQPNRPFLVTIDGNGQPGERFHPNTVFLSKKHAENHAAEVFIYNGIDPHSYDAGGPRSDTLVFLAKASWAVKNLDGAKQVARKLGLRLEVMGSRDWPGGLHRWMPTSRGVRYWGMVDDLEKRAILSRARALVFPVRWHEPFGVAITEALASGCGVYGTPYGSLPEIVTDAVGGLAVTAESLAKKVREGISSLDPARCRARVVDGPFTAKAMAEAYVKLYERILSTGWLSESQQKNPPQTRATVLGLSSKSLLPWS